MIHIIENLSIPSYVSVLSNPKFCPLACPDQDGLKPADESTNLRLCMDVARHSNVGLQSPPEHRLQTLSSVINHGLLENSPFSSMIFVAENVHFNQFGDAPATFDDTGGYGGFLK